MQKEKPPTLRWGIRWAVGFVDHPHYVRIKIVDDLVAAR